MSARAAAAFGTELVNGIVRVTGECKGGEVRKVVNIGRTLLSASRAENLVMRLSLAVPAFAGLLLGWAALAHADAPPAAPIQRPAPARSREDFERTAEAVLGLVVSEQQMVAEMRFGS